LLSILCGILGHRLYVSLFCTVALLEYIMLKQSPEGEGFDSQRWDNKKP
jgi:hypothetical protein